MEKLHLVLTTPPPPSKAQQQQQPNDTPVVDDLLDDTATSPTSDPPPTTGSQSSPAEPMSEARHEKDTGDGLRNLDEGEIEAEEEEDDEENDDEVDEAAEAEDVKLFSITRGQKGKECVIDVLLRINYSNLCICKIVPMQVTKLIAHDYSTHIIQAAGKKTLRDYSHFIDY